MYGRTSLRILTCCCILSAICTILCINANASGAIGWYCKRTTDHTQPALDSDLAIIGELDGYYVDRKHSESTQDKVIYLTFDAGYENGNVSKILDILKKEQVPGAFFVLENLVERNPDLVKRMANEGHLVCNHTSTHKNITKIPQSELTREIKDLENAYQALTGHKMAKYFRPPEGTFDQLSLQHVKNLGYKTVFWSFAYADWDNAHQMSAQSAMKKIMENLHNGEVMLLHPTSATNAEILEDLIRELKQMGYRFGTLDELCEEQ